YVLDGNAYFFSATEIVRRIFHLPETGATVVAIGYPPARHVLDPHRSADFTSPSSTYEPVLGKDGRPLTVEYGGAKEFLEVVEGEIMPLVSRETFPNVTLGPRALFGHSYGGLFTLHALFARPNLFNTFIAGSPSIWWNGKRILELETEFRAGRRRTGDVAIAASERRPQLFVMYGSEEQLPRKTKGESEESFEERIKYAAERGLKDSAVGVCRRLLDSGLLRKVWLQEFLDESHGSVAICELSRGTVQFLESCVDESEIPA
ncbi:Alpha/Beta hydrolase protein, partial [Macrophomina phaseolina]